MSTQTDINSAIIAQLEQAVHPLGLRQLSSLVRYSSNTPDHIVLRHLKQLNRQGEVEQVRRGWRLKGSESHVRPSFTALPQISKQTQQLIWKEQPWFEPREEHSDSQHEETGRWGRFRKLLKYYGQCIRNEEGADANAYLTQLNKSFFFLRRSGFWQPRAGARWQITIPIGPHLSELITQLPSSNDSTSLVVGYPLNATFKKGENGINVSVLRPVFFYPVQHEIVGKGLRISIELPVPEVNLGWLDYAFARKPDKQRNFLAACGFMRARMDGESTPGYEKGEAIPSLETLASALSSFLPGRIRESLDLGNIPDTPLAEPFENGIYNRAVVMLAKRTRYSRRLLDELEAISRAPDEILDTTALAPIFADSLPQKDIENEKPIEGVVADVFPFNPSQRNAVGSLLERNVSVVTGPPGTGKSQVVAGTAANARLQEKSVLIASRNHKAIDAVVHRLVDSLNEPMVVRTNSKEDPSLKVTFSTVVKAMLADQVDVDARECATHQLDDLASRLKERGDTGSQGSNLLNLSAELGETETRISYLHQGLPRNLTEFLDEDPKRYPSKLVHSATDRHHKQYSLNFFANYIALRRKFKQIPQTPDLPWWPTSQGRTLLHESSGLLFKAAEYAKLRTKAQKIESQIAELPPLETITEKVAQISERMSEIIPNLLTLDLKRRRGVRDERLRPRLAGLRAALRSIQTGLADGRLDRQANQEIKELGKEVLHAFPIWAVTNLSTGSRIPFSPALFDLTLIDEASQSDIPSAIPLLFRARRVGVIGDPFQLTHVSRLSSAKDTLMRRGLGLPNMTDHRFAYTESSLYDLCAGTPGANPIFLDTTYRSAEAIAEYSSAIFYRGGLKVGTSAGKLNSPGNMKLGIHWTECVDEIKSAGGSGCFCAIEVDEIVRQVNSILVEGNFKGSLGIVTPFRQQANRIQDALFASNIPYQALQNAEVHVDTAHGFQGDERDVILLSLCAGPDMPRGSRHFLRESGNLFNVAASRARAVLHVVGNRRWADRCGIPHIEKLARPEQCRPAPPPKGPWHPHESPYEELLFNALVQTGLSPKPQYPVRYRRLDMALVTPGENGFKLDIEVDGDCHRNPDGSRKTDDMWRDIELQGMGWKVVRFWTYQLREDLPGCVATIKSLWEQA